MVYDIFFSFFMVFGPVGCNWSLFQMSLWASLPNHSFQISKYFRCRSVRWKKRKASTFSTITFFQIFHGHSLAFYQQVHCKNNDSHIHVNENNFYKNASQYKLIRIFTVLFTCMVDILLLQYNTQGLTISRSEQVEFLQSV